MTPLARDTGIPDPQRSRRHGYLAAIGITAIVLAVRLAASRWFGTNVPYLPFYPAILLAAWLGGLGPGLLATGLSAVAAMYWLAGPAGLAASSAPGLDALTAFGATGACIAWLTARMRRAEADQRHAAALATARAQQLETIVHTTVDGIVVIEVDGTIHSFSPGAEAMLGYRADDVIGRPLRMLIPPPGDEDHDQYLARYLTTGEPGIAGRGREVAGRRRDGTTVPLHLTVGEMQVGGVRRFTAVVHDLTKRADLAAQLGASEARWEAVVESAVDAIVVIDVHGAIESFNPAAELLFGYQEADVLGRNVTVLMPSPYREEHDGYLSRYLATGRAKVIGVGREVMGRHQDGTVFPLHLSVGEAQVGGQRKFTGILHDLRERVRIEGALREQESLARLGEMAAVIAHEVKNPLAAIRGAVQVIGSRLPEENSDRRVITEVVARIDALDRLMKELLLFARPPVVHSAPTDLADLVAGTAGLLRRDPGMRDVEVEITGSCPAVSADAQLLSLAFQNLLVNAAHAMHGKGRVEVALGRDGSTCHVTVRDHGPGMPPDVLDRVFTPFFTTKARGSGLGLPTAKRLIEAHKGQITVSAPPGGGTTFHIELPLQPAPDLVPTSRSG